MPGAALGLVLVRAPDSLDLARLSWPEVLAAITPAAGQVEKLLDQPDAFLKDDHACREAISQLSHAQRVLKVVQPVLTEAKDDDQAAWLMHADECVSGWLSYFGRVEELLERRGELSQAVKAELLMQRFSLIGQTNLVTKTGF